MDRDTKTADPAAAEVDATIEADEARETAVEGRYSEVERAEREPAESRPSVGDDRVTPHLNDGR